MKNKHKQKEVLHSGGGTVEELLFYTSKPMSFT
jgi:hypothetical protein